LEKHLEVFEKTFRSLFRAHFSLKIDDFYQAKGSRFGILLSWGSFHGLDRFQAQSGPKIGLSSSVFGLGSVCRV
jgi:hypothetical protein